MLDPLEMIDVWNKLPFIEFHKVEDAVTEQIENIGYESHSFLKNLNTISLSLIFALSQLILMATLVLFKKWSSTLTKLYNFLSERLLFNGLLTISIEAYLEILITVLINLPYLYYDKSGEVISFIALMTGCALVFILLPAVTIFIQWILKKGDMGKYRKRIDYLMTFNIVKTRR